MICNTLSVQCAKSAQQQHVGQVYIQKDHYISSPRKYWDIMLWVHKKPNQSPPYSDTWTHTQNNLLISIHTFLYISVYFEIINTFILQGGNVSHILHVHANYTISPLSFQLIMTLLHCSTYCREHTFSDNKSTFTILVLTSYHTCKSSILNNN